MIRTLPTLSALALVIGLGVTAQAEAPGLAGAPDMPAGPQTDLAAAPSPDAASDVGAGASAGLAGLAGRIGDLPETQRAAVRAFYADRDNAAFWTEGGRGQSLVRALRDADLHGLPVRRYDPDALEALLADPAADPADVEITAMRAYLRMAADLATGLLTPRRVDPEIDLAPPRRETAALLDALTEAGSPADAFAALAPADPDYARLMAERERLAAQVVAGGWSDPVPAGPALRQGQSDPRVVALRERLAAFGHRTEGTGPGFDAELHRAVEAFQAEHGLGVDGIVGPATLGVLNQTPDRKLRQVLVNLERMRWMNRDLGSRHIWVNIPDYSVTLRDGDAVLFHERTVVGEHATKTPEFSDTMTYLVVNPTWHIPASIAQRVYLPQLQRNPNALAEGMRLYTRGGTEINPRLVDFSQFSRGNFPFTMKQLPGPRNALGRVKFMFPNQHAIYLHDTPSRYLFDRDRRTFSNGCVRVENPFELAHLLLAPQLDNPQATFRSWLDAGTERYVTLAQPIRVHLTYRTVFTDLDGQLQYRDDVYGRDARVFEALEAAGVYLPGAAG